ncbi:hypothetical protein AMECASPLE_013601 [Ameca splendens]|uniref:Uncharacterized protein n=1 Tax=Ameca splendens TaxID=208324 RepID=A0ABV1A7P9_9TELE
MDETVGLLFERWWSSNEERRRRERRCIIRVDIQVSYGGLLLRVPDSKNQGSSQRCSDEIHGGSLEVSFPTHSESKETELWNPVTKCELENRFPERRTTKRESAPF